MQGTHIGGTEKSSLTLMQEMQKKGVSFHVMSLTSMGKLQSHLDQANITYTGFLYEGFWGWKSFRNYRSFIKDSDADAIMMTGHNLIGMLAIGNKCKGKRSLFIHFHHQGVKSYFAWKIIYFFANIIFDKIYFASNFILNEAIKINPKIKNKSEYLPNPLKKKDLIDSDMRIISREKLGLRNDEIVIGNAGWLIKRKRFDVLLHVCSEIKKEKQNIKILIAGDGEERINLENLANDLGISENIIWLGWLDNLDDFFNSIDIMLFNSDWDSVGLSPLEAIQRGITTYASVINGGLDEILNNEYSLFIQNSHDVKKLSEKIINAINFPEETSSLTKECRTHINQLSSPQLIANRVHKNYFMEN